ncbi:MAG: haloacid dehalogenase type II [Hyphomicrobiales bacterium]|nr:haloacid dehalogenase type II [Hyphomicrobiales bacterium]
MTIRALVFDAYGTLYDVQSVRDLATELCGDKGELITQLWRLKQLEYTWLGALMGVKEDFWALTRASLEFALEAAGVAAESAPFERLMAKYLDLDLYPEARAALDALAGRKLAILSNGSQEMLDALMEASRITSLFADVISVDRAKTFKPDPACYALVEPALGVARDEVLFVSSNGFDVAGAKQFGFKVAWIERGGAAAVPPRVVGPAEMYRLLRGRAEKLGPAADFRVKALTDLPGVVARLE